MNTPSGCLAEPGPLFLSPGKLACPGEPTWQAFVRSWDDMPLDTWMGDGGTYRRRRYAAFEVGDGRCERLSHRPHYQARDYNPLNGGVERWFAPIAEDAAASPLFQRLLRDTAALIERNASLTPRHWIVEAHQFRIEAQPEQPGLPTPEGMHRDGRDWVLILLMGGCGFTGGETCVEDQSGQILLRHRLSEPGEALLLNDRALRHGTSPVEAAPAGTPAWRDTLVLTFAEVPAP
ncbi:2OG-Fe dioxygenase family protein [Novosphingobium album (ex Hu et al. 2023)]|uniref:2OG-Fe dioxygenase family protein n=1 Tax=Novosphingobium album (ex Hu et al. 2023) TaxID=2930093 RepID=A0ABT0B1W0_9SPHN|nr:2OG-Fe dioxygenase family protein [Novosphingobium album (ex Hu et al. 2023)]MCJ2178929.1 2OG-Fe dioxygenase family protein [Novosphingobium album (ex Hu et al. 2023)]